MKPQDVEPSLLPGPNRDPSSSTTLLPLPGEAGAPLQVCRARIAYAEILETI